jgi:2,4-dienoyl-CoA reductase-like NADH-dependent reductase (Old Yellow Enzyme family)
MSQFDYLFTPFKIGNVTVKNRIVFLPHFNALCNEDGMPSERDAYYFAERAKGGAGLIIMYAIAATRSGKMSERFIHGWDPKIIPALSTQTLFTNMARKFLGKSTMVVIRL